MDTIENIGITFYQSLGKLFYTIAATDKIVRTSKYISLKHLVKSEWLAVDDLEDEFGTDTAFRIEIIFNWLDYKELKAANCFKDFEYFYKENRSRFTDTIKQLIRNMANTIANAFSGKNKSELMMLGRLQ
ncbi:hypothetical protein ACWGOQ_0021675 [Aquimarina sp. M1]